MQKARAMAAVLLSMPLWTSPVQAQSSRPRQPTTPNQSVVLRRWEKITLLEFPVVQEELRLTPAQKAQLKESHDKLERKLERRYQELRENLRQLGDQPNPQMAAEINVQAGALRRGLMADADTQVLKSLDRSQRPRLDQIQMQAEGPRAFERPEVREKLNLDPGQVDAIATILAEGRQEMSRATEVSPEMLAKALTPLGDQKTSKINPAYAPALKAADQESDKARARVRGSINRMITQVLRKKQRETYRKMLGEPFDFSGSGHPSSPEKVEPKTQTDRPVSPNGTPKP